MAGSRRVSSRRIGIAQNTFPSLAKAGMFFYQNNQAASDAETKFSLKQPKNMGIITWIILGLVAGALAKLIMPGDQSNSWIMTILLGIVGAVLGGFIASQLGWGTVDGFNFRSILVAIGGSLLVLWIYSMLTRSRSRV
jgi:uncharacterized membrane protein YeaQ/YmgE (transglycosylase-associated protein family)